MEKQYVVVGNKVIEVGTAHTSTEYAALVASAKARKESDEREAKALADEEAKERAEKTALENQTNYYSKWRLSYVCDSILADYLFGDASIGSESADDASSVKRSCLGEINVKEVISSHPDIKKRFEGIFGKEP
ncbi:MAG: hypothetical protein WCR04_11995 [Fibrobacteraceae bacterium]|jgi:hypothetical protein